MIIQSRRVWIAGQFIEAQIEFENRKITNIYPYDENKAQIDYGSNRIVPGFIDIHTHGYDRWDTNDGTPDGLRHWMKEIPYEGVTGICPTTITQSHEVLSNALKNVAAVVEEGYEGAEILGIHFEGPYLDQKYKKTRTGSSKSLLWHANTTKTLLWHNTALHMGSLSVRDILLQPMNKLSWLSLTEHGP